MSQQPKISTAFLNHLSFFTSPQHPQKITFMSGLRSSLSLGLNFPASVLFSLALRYLYSPSLLIPFKAPNLNQLSSSQNRTMLETATTQTHQQNRNENGAEKQKEEDNNSKSYSKDDLLSLIPPDQNTLINRGHIIGLWALAADNQTGKVSSEDMRKIQDGSLAESLRDRRRIGRDANQVLPFLRGGPGNVAGHSWVVGKLFGVRVYEKKEKE